MTIKLSSLKGLEEPIATRVQRGFHRIGIGFVILTFVIGLFSALVVVYSGEFWQYIGTIIGITLPSAALAYASIMFFAWIVIGFLPDE